MTEPLLERLSEYIKNLTLEQATKLIILLSVLLVAFSVFYYFVIFLPQKEQTLLKLQKEEQEAKERKEAEERAAREMELGNCLLYARANYEENWANSCKAEARRREIDFQNCLSKGLDRHFCVSNWRPVDDSPNCSLPRETARRWDESLKEAKNECYKKYPQR